MSKLIYVCSKDKLPFSVGKLLQDICCSLSPDNIKPSNPKIIVRDNIAYSIMNPANSILEKDNSVLMGFIYGKVENWNIPLEYFPDGSYALFRDGDKCFEAVSDAVASRTIWYYFDKKIFISATSQRAIVMFLGSFVFNGSVIPWMLSTGNIGPLLSWDKRIKCIRPDSSVILDKNEWSISFKSNPIKFNIVKRSDEEHQKLLEETLVKTFKSLDIDFSSWVLPLSGGYDSRGILCLLHATVPNANRIRTITWGLKSSQYVRGNDAFIAKELANKLKIPHKYYYTDLSEEPVEKIISRFLLLGEGRTASLAGYVDGFRLWKELYEDGIQGIIRGEVGFSESCVSSPLTLRRFLHLTLCSDFKNLKDYKKYGFVSQEIPHHLLQREDETLNLWFDRLYQEYELPTMFAALTDLKLPYVELINPLLSKPILEIIRQLPDHLRSGKTLHKKIVMSLSPKVSFAKYGANARPESILRQKQIVAFLKDELSSKNAKEVFPPEFLDFILKGLKADDQEGKIKSSPLKSIIKRVFPKYIINAFFDNYMLSVDSNILAFRVLIIIKMIKFLNEDSKLRLCKYE